MKVSHSHPPSPAASRQLCGQSDVTTVAMAKGVQISFPAADQFFVNEALYFKLLVTILCFIRCISEGIYKH